MDDVVVNGTRYVPETTSGATTIGIGVTTRNRRDVADRTIEHIRSRTPNAKLVIVDDASDQPYPAATYRFPQRAGIARAKNKCLELLNGCEHIFLFDDDCYPIVDNWFQPYIDSPEPHLMYQFVDLANGHRLNDVTKVYDDGHHFALTGARGCMIYVHRSVIETVGGLDPEFGGWGWEHPSWSDRIYNAGLTSFRYGDVCGSNKLIHSMDEHLEVKRSVPTEERKAVAARNAELYWEHHYTSSHHIPVVEPDRRVVLTCLLSNKPDPQRNTRMRPDVKLLETLITSITGGETVVLCDNPLTHPQASFERVTSPVDNPYFARWYLYYQWLRANPDVKWVWCVDGTDVEMLTPPWEHMQPGKLYIGHEPAVVGIDWMRNNHKATHLQQFIDTHADRTLLNAGIVGGDRETVMAFAHDMAADHEDQLRRVWHKDDAPGTIIGDMATLNYVAYTKHADQLIHGPQVVTVFKSNERNAWSWWRHK
ncbi:glycosyltransferase [Mycobacterium phage ArcusAngelus]|uniref:Glycosyltransferase n=1 Tax=Mycobacterium phage ArcusAngelus TaxID=2315613 RepID=A0A386KS20_9CAUD|nr:glycosyltransferase [Mycobacterium phage ArcusAngelus]AYD87849.1 glycosyltransferase [Mycobacterium phage ArcusAngelus]